MHCDIKITYCLTRSFITAFIVQFLLLMRMLYHAISSYHNTKSIPSVCLSIRPRSPRTNNSWRSPLPIVPANAFPTTTHNTLSSLHRTARTAEFFTLSPPSISTTRKKSSPTTKQSSKQRPHHAPNLNPSSPSDSPWSVLSPLRVSELLNRAERSRIAFLTFPPPSPFPVIVVRWSPPARLQAC